MLKIELPSGARLRLSGTSFTGLDKLTTDEYELFRAQWAQSTAEADEVIPGSADDAARRGQELGYWSVIELANTEHVVGRVY